MRSARRLLLQSVRWPNILSCSYTKMAGTVCFSDLDGTLIHYVDNPAALKESNPDILLLPSSSTGKTGIISRGTLERMARLRANGTRVVLITGARTSTLIQRAPHLPQADAYVSENGGRIFYCDDCSTGKAEAFCEDMDWRERHSAVAGPSSQDEAEAADRQGELWAWYRQLKGDGWKLDAVSYATAFRLSLKGSAGKTPADLQAVIASRPAALDCSFNLGAADFYPSTSGKDRAAQYLISRFSSHPSRAIFLCDDDNDLALAALVGKVFLPSVATASVAAAAAAAPHKFVVSSKATTDATEEMLDAAHAHIQALLLAPAGAAASN